MSEEFDCALSMRRIEHEWHGGCVLDEFGYVGV